MTASVRFGTRPHGTGAERLLTSVAFLKASHDAHGTGFIENFVPFALEATAGLDDAQGDLEEIRAAVRETFALDVPVGAMNTILRWAVRSGVMERDAKLFTVVDDEVVKDNARRRAAIRRHHEALIEKLVAFARNEHAVEVTVDEADTAFLSYVEERAVPLIKSMRAGGTLEHGSTSSDQMKYIVGAFILEADKRDAETFEYIESVVEGSMLASVLYFEDIGRVSERLAGVTAYFDTPLLLDLLGVGGEPVASVVREMVSLLGDVGGTAACFERTLTEVCGVLDGMASSAAARRGRGGAARARLGPAMSSSDLRQLSAQVQRRLASAGIELRPEPPRMGRTQIDMKVFEDHLEEAGRYPRRNAVIHDVEAVDSVHRLRAGVPKQRLENCAAVFVTRNAPLLAVTHSVFRDHVRFPLAIGDHEFSTLVWLKKPLSAPDLPRKRIIADCYIAMQPSNALWQKFSAEIDRLRDAGEMEQDDYHLLKYELDAPVILAEKTLGDPSAIGVGTVDDVLEAAKEALTAPLRAEVLDVKADATRIEAAKESLERQLTDQVSLVEQNAARFDHLEGRLDKIEERVEERAARRAGRIARAVSVSVHLMLSAVVILVALGIVSSASSPIFGIGWDRLAGGLVAGLALVDAIQGWSVRQISSWVQERVEPRVLARERRWMLGETDAAISRADSRGSHLSR